MVCIRPHAQSGTAQTDDRSRILETTTVAESTEKLHEPRHIPTSSFQKHSDNFLSSPLSKPSPDLPSAPCSEKMGTLVQGIEPYARGETLRPAPAGFTFPLLRCEAHTCRNSPQSPKRSSFVPNHGNESHANFTMHRSTAVLTVLNHSSNEKTSTPSIAQTLLDMTRSLQMLGQIQTDRNQEFYSFIDDASNPQKITGKWGLGEESLAPEFTDPEEDFCCIDLSKDIDLHSGMFSVPKVTVNSHPTSILNDNGATPDSRTELRRTSREMQVDENPCLSETVANPSKRASSEKLVKTLVNAIENIRLTLCQLDSLESHPANPNVSAKDFCHNQPGDVRAEQLMFHSSMHKQAAGNFAVSDLHSTRKHQSPKCAQMSSNVIENATEVRTLIDQDSSEVKCTFQEVGELGENSTAFGTDQAINLPSTKTFSNCTDVKSTSQCTKEIQERKGCGSIAGWKRSLSKLKVWAFAIKEQLPGLEDIILEARRARLNVDFLTSSPEKEDISMHKLNKVLAGFYYISDILEYLWKNVNVTVLESSDILGMETDKRLSMCLKGMDDLLVWADKVAAWVSKRCDFAPGIEKYYIKLQDNIDNIDSSFGFFMTSIHKNSGPTKYLMETVTALSRKLGLCRFVIFGNRASKAYDDLMETKSCFTKSVTLLLDIADQRFAKQEFIEYLGHKASASTTKKSDEKQHKESLMPNFPKDIQASKKEINPLHDRISCCNNATLEHGTGEYWRGRKVIAHVPNLYEEHKKKNLQRIQSESTSTTVPTQFEDSLESWFSESRTEDDWKGRKIIAHVPNLYEKHKKMKIQRIQSESTSTTVSAQIDALLSSFSSDNES